MARTRVAHCFPHSIEIGRDRREIGSVTTLGEDGQGAETTFDSPCSVAVDGEGNIIVAERGNDCVRKIAPDGTVGVEGRGTEAMFKCTEGIAVDGEGNIIVADIGNDCVRKIAPDGTVTTLAGDSRGYKDGQGTEAMFDCPEGVAVDGEGNIIVADSGNNCRTTACARSLPTAR